MCLLFPCSFPQHLYLWPWAYLCFEVLLWRESLFFRFWARVRCSSWMRKHLYLPSWGFCPGFWVYCTLKKPNLNWRFCQFKEYHRWFFVDGLDLAVDGWVSGGPWYSGNSKQYLASLCRLTVFWRKFLELWQDSQRSFPQI